MKPAIWIIHPNVLNFVMCIINQLLFFQITHSHYQKGVTTSRFDNSPQSPDSGHTLVDNSTSSAPNPSLENMLTLTDNPDETTSLLNEQNSLSARQANHNTHNESAI